MLQIYKNKVKKQNNRHTNTDCEEKLLKIDSELSSKK